MATIIVIHNFNTARNQRYFTIFISLMYLFPIYILFSKITHRVDKFYTPNNYLIITTVRCTNKTFRQRKYGKNYLNKILVNYQGK